MTYNRHDFYKALLDAIDAPHSKQNLAALEAWGECEGSEAEYNPLDTTWHEAGATPYNSFESGGSTLHVWNYPDQETGVRATVSTLESDYYPHILQALKDGSGDIVSGAAHHEMGTWGTNADCIAGKLKGDDVPDKPAKDDKPATDPVRLTEEDRNRVALLARHLHEREHRLTDDDAEHIKRLRTSVNHALKVR